MVLLLRGGILAGPRVIVGLTVTRAMMVQFGCHGHQILALQAGGRDIISRQGRVGTSGTGNDLVS